MWKAIVAALTVMVFLGWYAFTEAQRGPGGPGRHMMGQGGGPRWQQGPGMGMTDQTAGPWGSMGPGAGMWGHMGPGTMGHMGHMGMGMFGGGMMAMMGSPEIMGSMMSIHGEMLSLNGRLMQKYGSAFWQTTPEVQQKMNKDTLEGMGEILAKHGAALKERARALGQ